MAKKAIFCIASSKILYHPSPPLDKIFGKSPLESVDLAHVWDNPT